MGRMSPSQCEHQWVLAAGPWPQYQTFYEQATKSKRALVDTHCRYCRRYSERTIVTNGAWTPRRANKAMERSGIWWK
jgi:hypothetical protein